MSETLDKFAGKHIIPCGKCAYYVLEARGNKGDLGFCRLDPPSVVAVHNADDKLVAKSVLPIVYHDQDGCAQGELTEEATC